MPNPTLDQDRVALLAAREQKEKVRVPAWPRQQKELPKVEVEVAWVRFSTMNHRTKAEQLQKIHHTGRPTLFSADPLGKEAQDAQYEILSQQEGFEALKQDLRKREQQEPAIITADGVLINGNRRSAALRSLYLTDNWFKARYVTCLVLPQDATAEELVDLEAELQVARDFKQEYSWINEALLIEELYDREGKDFSRVATRMHRDVSDVRALHEKLQQVHQLVALSQGARLHIDFNDNESAFDELARHIRNKAPAEADGVRAAYFLGTLANVEYRKLRNLQRADAAELIRHELESDPALKPVLETAESSLLGAQNEDPLDDLLGEATPTSPLNGLLGFVAAKRPEESLTLVGGGRVSAHEVLETLKHKITAVANEAEEEKREQTAVKAPLMRADKAIGELQRIITTLPKARTLNGWDESTMAKKIEMLEGLLAQIKECR